MNIITDQKELMNEIEVERRIDKTKKKYWVIFQIL